MVALSEKIKKPPTMDILKLFAAKWAVYFSLETDFTKLVFEGDAEFVIKSFSVVAGKKLKVGTSSKTFFPL